MEKLPSENNREEPKHNENSEERITKKIVPKEKWDKCVSAVTPFLDEKGVVKEVPPFIEQGEMNKDLFGGLLIRGPLKVISGAEQARTAINFLKKINEQLNDNVLAKTIDFLEHESTYLDEAEEVLKKNRKDFFSSTKAEMDSNTKKINDAISFCEKTGYLFSDWIDTVYGKLWDKYMTDNYVLGSENNTFLEK